MNNVILIGNVVNDLELKVYTDQGEEKKYVRFTLAINEYVSKTKETIATFVDVVAFAKKAEVLCQYVSKGSKLAVEGKLRTGSYINNEGQKRYTVDIVLNDFTFIDNRKAVNENIEVSNAEVPF